MATEHPGQQKRMTLVQIGVSAFVGLLALFVLQTGTDKGPMSWVLLAVALVSVGEVAWLLLKYLRLTREQERII